MRTSRFVLYASLVVSLLVLLPGCCGTRKNDPAVQVRSERVQTTLGKIATALEQYLLDHGNFPKGIATLRSEAYLLLDPDFEKAWEIHYWTDGDQVTLVDAISTKVMPDGEGWRVAYRPGVGSFEGYGIDKFPKGKK